MCSATNTRIARIVRAPFRNLWRAVLQPCHGRSGVAGADAQCIVRLMDQTDFPKRAAHEVVIVGAGFVGPALALALAQGGLSVLLVDREVFDTRLSPTFDGRSFAISLANSQLFKHLGLWPVLAPHAQPIDDILVTDGRVGEGVSPLSLHFDHREAGDQPLGFMVEQRRIRAALYSAITEHPEIEVLAPGRVEAFEATPGAMALTLSSEAGAFSARAKVLVAADGKASPTRERAGIKSVAWTYEQDGIVLTVAHERPHEGVAQEYFLPGGPFAILPLTENRSSLVWTEWRKDADRLMALEDADFQDELEQRFGDFLGAVTPIGPRYRYPLSLHIARRFVAPRLALLGDAAHGIHPIAGQGLNLGLKDVAALAEVLIEATRLGQDPGGLPVLEEYERWRRFDTATLAVTTELLNRLFSNDIGPVRLVRDLGLGLVNEIGPLRRLFMRHAGGQMGELPRLLQP